MTAQPSDEEVASVEQSIGELVAVGLEHLPEHLRTADTTTLLRSHAAMLMCLGKQLVEYMHQNFATSAASNREWAERMRAGLAEVSNKEPL